MQNGTPAFLWPSFFGTPCVFLERRAAEQCFSIKEEYKEKKKKQQKLKNAQLMVLRWCGPSPRLSRSILCFHVFPSTGSSSPRIPFPGGTTSSTISVVLCLIELDVRVSNGVEGSSTKSELCMYAPIIGNEFYSGYRSSQCNGVNVAHSVEMPPRSLVRPVEVLPGYAAFPSCSAFTKTFSWNIAPNKSETAYKNVF